MANEDLLLRQMPHSLEGEQAVLGSMLIDADCVKDVMDKLRPSDFYLRQNREIFETIYSMFTYAKPIDGITVCEEMQKAGTYDENTTRSYLAQLMEITPTSANVMEYAAIVRDKALLRGVAQAAAEITAMVQEGVGEASEILEAAEQKVYAVRRGQSAQDMVPLRQVLPEVLDRLGEMSESENHLPGLSTGLSAVDQKITGLNKSDLILLAARPGMGKTSFALNMALNVAKSTPQDRGGVLSGNVPGAAGHPLAGLRGTGGEQPPQDRLPSGRPTGRRSPALPPSSTRWISGSTTTPCCPWRI